MILKNIIEQQNLETGYLIKYNGKIGVAAYHIWSGDGISNLQEMVCFWDVAGWLIGQQPDECLLPESTDSKQSVLWLNKGMPKPFGWLAKNRFPYIATRRVLISEKSAINRLYYRARDKKEIALLLLNAYNSFNYKVDMRFIMRYSLGESSDSLERDVFTFIRFLKKGVELHEVLGAQAVQRLIEYWNLQ